MSFTRLVLFTAALAFFCFGVAYALVPVQMAQLTGVTATNNVGTTDIRAVYGGLQIGIASFLAPWTSSPEKLRMQLTACASICGAVAAVRVMGIVLDGSFNRVHVVGLAFEVTLTALSLLALRRPIRNFV